MTPSILRAALEEALMAGVTYGRQRGARLQEAEVKAWVEEKAEELMRAYDVPDRAEVEKRENES